MRAHHFEVVEIERVAAATDHAGVSGARELGLDVVLHLDLVAVGQDDDARIFLVGIGNDQLADDRIDFARPAEDQRVVLLDDARTALAQLGQSRLQAGSDGADQDADEEDAGDGDHQHQQAEWPAAVVRQIASIKRMHQPLPGSLDQAESGRGIGRVLGDADQRQHERGNADNDR